MDDSKVSRRLYTPQDNTPISSGILRLNQQKPIAGKHAGTPSSNRFRGATFDPCPQGHVTYRPASPVSRQANRAVTRKMMFRACGAFTASVQSATVIMMLVLTIVRTPRGSSRKKRLDLSETQTSRQIYERRRSNKCSPPHIFLHANSAFFKSELGSRLCTT